MNFWENLCVFTHHDFYIWCLCLPPPALSVVFSKLNELDFLLLLTKICSWDTKLDRILLMKPTHSSGFYIFCHPKIDRTLYFELAGIHKYQRTVLYLTCFINRSTQNTNSSSTGLVKQKQTTSCVTNVANNVSISTPLFDTCSRILPFLFNPCKPW